MASEAEPQFETMSSNETAEEMEANFQADDQVTEEQKRSEAAAKLGKAGGEATARKGAEEAKPEEKPEAKPEEKAEKPEEKPEKLPHAQARIAQLARERAAEREQAKAELDALKAEVAALKGVKPEEKAEGPDPNAEPDIETYEDLQEYFRDLSKFQARTLIQAERAKMAQETERAGQESLREKTVSANEERIEGFFGRMEEAGGTESEWVKELYASPLGEASPTFLLGKDEVPGPLNDMLQCAVDSDIGPQVLRHLVENPPEFTRIAGLSDSYAVIQAMGALGAKVRSDLEGQKPPDLSKTVSNAAPPVKPLPSSSHQAEPDEYGDDVSLDEYLRKTAVKDGRA